MQKYVCDVCGYVYDPAAGDPDNGVAPGTAWEDLPPWREYFLRRLPEKLNCDLNAGTH